MRGVFITFEGVEGAGKSSLIAGLADLLRADGREVCLTREPGEGVSAAVRDLLLAGEALRPLSWAFYMLLDRHEHVGRVVAPALARGAVVLCDRFTDSTLAYQGGGLGLPIPELARMNALAIGDTRPDLTILLDLDPEVGLARVRARAPQRALDRFEAETLAFHRRVRAAYLELAGAEPGRIRVVDGLAPRGDVLARVRVLVGEVLTAA